MSSIQINGHPFSADIQQQHKSREVQLTPSALETLSSIKEEIHKTFESNNINTWILHDDDATTIKASVQKWKEHYLLHVRFVYSTYHLVTTKF